MTKVELITVEVLPQSEVHAEVSLSSQAAFAEVVLGNLPGERGEPGEPGEPGQPGEPGADGADGRDGVDGADGADGKSLNPRGDYDAATTYERNDMVRDQQASWIALQTTLGNAPPVFPTESNAYWQIINHDSDFDGNVQVYVQTWAQGTTTGLEQKLLATDGRLAQTALAVPVTGTGRVQGERPYSKIKIFIALLIVALIAGGIGYLMATGQIQ